MEQKLWGVPEDPRSYWIESLEQPSFPALTENAEADVVVVGGGMVGILTAFNLVRQQKRVILIEAGKLLRGVTGHTTAKVTAQHSLLYHKLLRIHGREKAQAYYSANLQGLQYLRGLIEELAIDCDAEEKDAVVFASTAMGKKQILSEMRAYQELGIDGYYTADIPDFPLEVTAALGMPKQMQFHPLKFLAAIVQQLVEAGCLIYEDSRVQKVRQEQDKVEAELENGVIVSGKDVVISTHYPVTDKKGLYFSRLSVSRSYVLVGSTGGPVPKAMYINAESPSRTVRSVKDEAGNELLLVGGEDHKTGRSEVPETEHYQNLNEFARQNFDDFHALYRWSTQDMATLDLLPYIGNATKNEAHVWLATGFNKWGMTNSAVASLIITGCITEGKHLYRTLYDPSRSHFNPAAATKFLTENSVIGKEYVVNKVKPDATTVDKLAPDEGSLVRINGHLLGAYRDRTGKLHLVDPTCTHMGCTVLWNEAERSWDCSCHGSRFNYDGEVLHGPSTKPLKKESIPLK